MIDAEPIPSRKAQALTQAYQAIFQHWKATGAVSPNWHILYNEVLEKLKQAIHENKCREDLNPADQHRQNAAKHAIQTFKGHFISVLAGVADNFQVNQSDELLPQTVLTFNVLQQSNAAPNISAWAHHHGSLITITCRSHAWVVPFRSTSNLADENCLTSEEHYQAHIMFIKKTHAKRLADMVFFKYKYIPQPTVMPADAYNKLLEAIQGIQHSKDGAHFKFLQQTENTLQSTSNQPIQETQAVKLPRMDQQKEI
ncbi:hypothetical protein ACHAW6_016162 [Cyclotella cf. meneghiniana]